MAAAAEEEFVITTTEIILGDAFAGEVASSTEVLLSEISSSIYSIAGDIMTERMQGEIMMNAGMFFGESQDLFSDASLQVKQAALGKTPSFLSSIAAMWARDLWNIKVYEVHKDKSFNLWYWLNRGEAEKEGKFYKWGPYTLNQFKPKWYYLNYYDDKTSEAYLNFKKAKDDWYYGIISLIFSDTWYYRDKKEQIILDAKSGKLLNYRGVLFTDKMVWQKAIEQLKTWLVTFRMYKILYWNWYWKSNYIIGKIEFNEIPESLRLTKPGASSAPRKIHVYTPFNMGVDRNDFYFNKMKMNSGVMWTSNETKEFSSLWTGRSIATDTFKEEFHDTNLATYFKKTKEQVREDHTSVMAYRIMDEVWTIWPKRGFKFTGPDNHTPNKTPDSDLEHQKELFDFNIPEKHEWFGSGSDKYNNGILYYKQEIKDYIEKKNELYLEFLNSDYKIGDMSFLKFLGVLLKPNVEFLYENPTRNPELLLAGEKSKESKELKVGDKVRKKFNKVEGVINKIQTISGDLKYAVTFKNDESGEEWVLGTGIELIPPPPKPQRFPLNAKIQADYFGSNYWYDGTIILYKDGLYNVQYDSGDVQKKMSEKLIRHKPVWVYDANGDLKTGELQYINADGTFWVSIDDPGGSSYGHSFNSVMNEEPHGLAKSKFSIGDRVKSGDDTKIGFIKSINYNLPISYSVQLDNGNFLTANDTWLHIPNNYINYDLKFELDQICMTSGWYKDKHTSKLNWIKRIIAIYEIQSRAYHYYRVYDQQNGDIFSIDEKDLKGVRRQLTYEIGTSILFYTKSGGLKTGKITEYLQSYFDLDTENRLSKINDGYKIKADNVDFIVPPLNMFPEFIEGKVNVKLFSTMMKKSLKLYIAPKVNAKFEIGTYVTYISIFTKRESEIGIISERMNEGTAGWVYAITIGIGILASKHEWIAEENITKSDAPKVDAPKPTLKDTSTIVVTNVDDLAKYTLDIMLI